GVPKPWVREQSLELGKTHPGAADESVPGVVLLERDDVAKGRRVVEDGEQDKRRERHQQELPVATQPGMERNASSRTSTFGHVCALPTTGAPPAVPGR